MMSNVKIPDTINTQLKMICASVTIFNQDNCINDSAMQQLWEKIIREGADGLFVNGSAGECFLLSFKEKIHLFELAGAFSPRIETFAHVGSVSTSEAIELARAAKSCGMKNIASTPPFYFAFSPKEIAGYYYDLASSINEPVLYYDIPSSTHVDLDTSNPDIIEMLKSGVIRFVKHTNLDSARMKDIRAVNPDIRIYGGFETRILQMLNYGCNGFIGSTFNFMLPQYKKILEFYREHRTEELNKTVSASTDIVNLLLSSGLASSIKYILKKQGIDAGNARKPFLPLSNEARLKIDQELHEKLKYI